MVECRTPEREVSVSILTRVAVLSDLPLKSTGNTQETVAPSRHDRKIVDLDVKPQPKQTYKKRICRFL